MEVELRTGAWYGDRPIRLPLPAGWEVTVISPRAFRSLTQDEIVAALERPTGQPPLGRLCRGKKRPLIIIDDINRPTPVDRILPYLLKQFHDAGIFSKHVTILLSTGTHGAPRMESVMRKIGLEAADCRILIHDPRHNLERIGRTSFGTPVFVNRELAGSDLLIGIGGIYPNYTAGFGGGSKLALGVLGFDSIMNLHYRHRARGWGLAGSSGALAPDTFRKDLDEIARMIRLNTMISLHVNEEREIMRIACGDHFHYYAEEAAFAARICPAPAPSADTDVVISNAWPNDLSLTFARMKGMTPLHLCAPAASRIAIAACSEGLGHHGLFPVVNRPPFYRVRKLYRALSVMSPGEIARKILARGSRAFAPGKQAVPRHPIWLYCTGKGLGPYAGRLAGLSITSSWPEVVSAISREQGNRENLKVLIYPCAPLQVPDVGLSVSQPHCEVSRTGDTMSSRSRNQQVNQ